MVKMINGIEIPSRIVCPKCGNTMVRFYIVRYEGSKNKGWESVGFYCKVCGTSISDIEYVKLKKMGRI